MTKYIYFLMLGIIFFGSCQKDLPQPKVIKCEMPYNNELRKCLFITDSIGIIVGGKLYTETKIFRTTDAGYHWSEMNIEPANSVLMDVCKSDSQRLMATGYDSRIYFSDDTGLHWERFQNQTWCILNGLQYTAYNQGFAVGDRTFKRGKFLTLNSYGETKTEMEFNFSLYDLMLIDENKMIASGSGIVMYSSDGGNFWEASNARGDKFIKILENPYHQFLAFGYEGKIIKSEDNGHSWFTQRERFTTTQSAFRIRDAICTNQNVQIIVGDKGLIAYSTDDWANWTVMKSFTSSTILSITEKSNGQFLLSTSKGEVYILNFSFMSWIKKYFV